MLFLMSLSISGCATVSGGSFCAGTKPIYFDDEQQAKDTPAPIRRQIRDHNRKWEDQCGW